MRMLDCTSYVSHTLLWYTFENARNVRPFGYSISYCPSSTVPEAASVIFSFFPILIISRPWLQLEAITTEGLNNNDNNRMAYG